MYNKFHCYGANTGIDVVARLPMFKIIICRSIPERLLFALMGIYSRLPLATSVQHVVYFDTSAAGQFKSIA